MQNLSKVALLVAALGMSACTDPSRFGLGGSGAGGTGADGSMGMGSVSDPTSPAYFNQTIGDRVLFAVDESNISPEAAVTLRAQAQWLMTNPEYTARIEGHADEQGTREYNLALGARRASAVQEFLVAQGVSPGRLSTVSYGKERPIEICSDESCYRQNRRAVTVLAAGGPIS